MVLNLDSYFSILERFENSNAQADVGSVNISLIRIKCEYNDLKGEPKVKEHERLIELLDSGLEITRSYSEYIERSFRQKSELNSFNYSLKSNYIDINAYLRGDNFNS